MRQITVDLSSAGIEKAIQELDRLRIEFDEKAQILVDRLADEGVYVAQFYFDMGVYDGPKDVKVYKEPRGDKCVAVVAVGEAVLFLEYGAGYYMGYGHPEPEGYGPGTYPGKGHWNDPKGWYLPKDKQAIAGTDHSIGNPPTAAMYNARKEIEQKIEQIAAEVFR